MTCILHTHAYTLTHAHHYTRYKLGWAPKSAQKPVRIRNIASTRRGGGGGGRVRISAGAAVPSISDFLWSVWSQVPLPPPIPPPNLFFFFKAGESWLIDVPTDLSWIWNRHVTCVNESCHTRTGQYVHIRESCRTWMGQVMSHMDRVSHVTYG